VVTVIPKSSLITEYSISNPPASGKKIINIYWDTSTQEIVIITED